MHKRDDWPGKEEETQIEYEILSEQNSSGRLAHDSVLLSNNLSSEYCSTATATLIKADKSDCLIAASIGVLTGMMDVFWVGELSLLNAQAWGRSQVNQFVIKAAHHKGYNKDSLDGAIRYLEKKYANPSDKLTSKFGGGLQHHLRDFSHHLSPFGLVCSIITQFTEEGYGTDTDGNFLHPMIVSSDAIGNTFEEKVFLGVVNWFYHLVSDMAGSSQSAGAGTGIPGLLLSMLNEASTLPLIKEIKINYKEERIDLSKWISKLFNGTAFPHQGLNNIVRLDLRTEIGIGYHMTKENVPVIINQCLVRGFYFIKRLVLEIKNKNIYSIKDLKRLDPQNFMPGNNRCISRMATISSGIFMVIDVSDSIIRGTVNKPQSKADFVKDFVLRVNFVGIANFAFAFKNDAKYIATDIKDTFQIKAKKLLENQETIVGKCSIEVEVVMDNSNLYQYTFDSLLKQVKRSKDALSTKHNKIESELALIFDLGDSNYSLYDAIVSANEERAASAVEELLRKMFEQNNIPFSDYPVDPIYSKMSIEEQRKSLPFSFVMIEDGRKIGYYFPNRSKNVLQHPENYDVDEIKFVKMYNPDESGFGYQTIIEEPNKCKEKCGRPIQYYTIKKVFDSYFGSEEFTIFMSHVNDFNERARYLIGYNTVLTPTEEALAKFRDNVSAMLCEYPYKDFIPDGIFKSQIDILYKNYIERGLYKAMSGDAPFADSFISSEWFYKLNQVTESLDQTGIVAGYLKSVEQLLFAVIRLSKDSGKTIRTRDKMIVEYTTDNEKRIDSTLGSLVAFIRHNSSILNVTDYVKRYIVDTINDWRENQRNGYFHKDNLHDMKKVDEIRQRVIYLYFLILGGCTIYDEEFGQLGILNKKKQKAEYEGKGFLYEDFTKWLDSILHYGLPKDATAISYNLYDEKNNSWSLQLTATGGFDDYDYKLFFDEVFSSKNNIYTWQSVCSWKESLSQAIEGVKQYLAYGTFADKLKSYIAVAVAYKDQVEVVYRK